MERQLFNKDFIILEIANNHWGDVECGIKNIKSFMQIVRFNYVDPANTAIKIPLLYVDTCIHKDFRDREDKRYIKKTLATQMSNDDYHTLVIKIREIISERYMKL